MKESSPTSIVENIVVTSIFPLPTVFSKVVSFLCDNEVNYNQKKGLILSQMTNFRLFQTDRVCKRQFKI